MLCVAASTNDQVELAATGELLDLFTGYLDADINDAQMQPVNNFSIDFDSDFFTDDTSASQISALARTQSNHAGSFDVTQLSAR